MVLQDGGVVNFKDFTKDGQELSPAEVQLPQACRGWMIREKVLAVGGEEVEEEGAAAAQGEKSRAITVEGCSPMRSGCDCGEEGEGGEGGRNEEKQARVQAEEAV